MNGFFFFFHKFRTILEVQKRNCIPYNFRTIQTEEVQKNCQHSRRCALTWLAKHFMNFVIMDYSCMKREWEEGSKAPIEEFKDGNGSGARPLWEFPATKTWTTWST